MPDFDVIELREYRILPRNRARFWQNYQDNGLPIQLKYLNNPMGFYFVDVGSPYTFIHMWAYRSLAQREKDRAALHHDADWNAYVKSAHAFIEDINVRLLKTLGMPEAVASLPGAVAYPNAPK